MMGLLVVHGALAGAFSPISVYGVFINGFLSKQGLATSPLSLFLAPLLFNLMFVIVVYLVLRTRPDPDMLARPDEAVEAAVLRNGSAVDGREAVQRLTAYQIATLVALAVMVVLVVGFDLNIGVVSMALAAVLAILRPREGMAALGRVSWPVVVLITGVLTYIAVLQRAGTVEWVSSGISAVSIPLVAALLLFYVSGLISSLASTLGVIGVVIALAVPFLRSGDVNVAGFVAALGNLCHDRRHQPVLHQRSDAAGQRERRHPRLVLQMHAGVRGAHVPHRSRSGVVRSSRAHMGRLSLPLAY